MLWWDKVRLSLSPDTVTVIEDFMVDGLVIQNIHPRRLAQLAFRYNFNDPAVLNLDWEAVCQYYSVKLHTIEFLRNLPADGYVVGNSHDDSCSTCSEIVESKVYAVKDAPDLPCCEFCRCCWTQFLPDMSYIKNGRIECVLGNETEDERVMWIKENRKLFNGKYETPNLVDESTEGKKLTKKLSDNFRSLLINDPERLKFLIEHDRPTLKILLNKERIKHG